MTMKIKITYAAEEDQEVTRTVNAIKQLHPHIRVHKSDRHPPYKHLYLTVKNGGIPRRNGKNA